jgi:soluble cytochrome b562
MNERLEEQASLERMRAQLVEAENALARADKWLEEASTTAQRLGSHGTEWNEGGIAPIRDPLSQSREGLSRLITNLDDRIEGPGD